MTRLMRALLVAASMLSAGALTAALVALLGRSGASGANRSADRGLHSTVLTRSTVLTISSTMATSSPAVASATATTSRTPVAISATSAKGTSSSATLGHGPGNSTPRMISVSERAELHLLKAYGNTLLEEGQATGSLPGTVKVNIDINPARGSARASFTLYRPDGTLSGHSFGRARPAHEGWEGFSGGMQLESGTGRYARASGSGSMSGAIYRRTDRMIVQQSGRLSY